MAFQLDSNIPLLSRGADLVAASQQGLQIGGMLADLQNARELQPIRKQILEQSAQEGKLLNEQNQQAAAQANQAQLIDNVANAYSSVKSLVDAGKFSEAADQLEANKAVRAQSGATNFEDTDAAIAALRGNNPKEINRIKLMGEQAIKISEARKQAELPPITANQQQTLDLKREALEMRKIENETRRLEQELKQEDNQVRREKLELEIKSKRQKVEQQQRDVVEAAEDSISQVNSTLETIDRVRNHEGLDSATGAQSLFPTFPGSEAANFEAQIETLQSQQFLSAVNQMKGMGALSENEGKKLASSVGALSLSMSDKAMRKELDRIYDITEKARDKMVGRLPAQSGEASAKDTGITIEQFKAMTPEQRQQVLQQQKGK